MDIVWTILIIIGTILGAFVIGPFIMFGFIALLGGAVMGFLFYMMTALAGVEPTGGVILTCFIAGVLFAGGIGVFVVKDQAKASDD